jgi:ABC-type nitrate/sulfonate/bicarbonate transport system substrate-binding protein
MRFARRLLMPTLVAMVAAASMSSVAAQEKLKIRAASLTLPVVNPVIVNVMKEKGFDTKHGFELEIKPYPSISAFYVALATGEVDTLIGGPTVLQKMRAEGVPVKIVATAMRLSDLVILTANPAVKTFADLKGKQLAADMGSQQYQVVSMYGRAKGLGIGTDVTVVQANFALARSQLAAGRVDAAMVIEPIATLMMKDNPQLRMIFNGSAAWKEIAGSEGWELVVAMRGDFIKKNPNAPKQWLAAMQDFAAFAHKNPSETDAIAVATVKLPPGILKDVVASKRWEFDVMPAWGPERKVLMDMFERAVAAKFLEKMPDDGIIYAP